MALTSLSTFRQRNVERELGDVPDLPLANVRTNYSSNIGQREVSGGRRFLEHWSEGDRGRPRPPSEHSAGGMFRGRSEPIFDRLRNPVLGGKPCRTKCSSMGLNPASAVLLSPHECSKPGVHHPLVCSIVIPSGSRATILISVCVYLHFT